MILENGLQRRPTDSTPTAVRLVIYFAALRLNDNNKVTNILKKKTVEYQVPCTYKTTGKFGL
jgi:hypothetical protein